jgi:aspartyl protease family protein
MNRGLTIILGLIGAAALVLILNHDRGTSFGVANDQFASLVYLGVWGGVLAAGILGSGMRFGDVARQLLAWLAIVLVLVAGYQYRYELQDIGSRMTAGLIPGSPLSTAGADGRVTVMIEKASNGHFGVTATVNGASIPMLVDTGASSTVLTADAARAAGFDTATLAYVVPVSTANGPALAAEITIEELAVGDIKRIRSRAMVAEPGKLDQSLLGMTFLGSLTGFDVRGDRLILHD